MTTVPLTEFQFIAVLAMLAMVAFCAGYYLGREREW